MPSTKTITRHCLACGKEFHPFAYECRRNPRRGRYCSRGCRNTGKHNPMWAGGVSKDNMRYRRIAAERHPEIERIRARDRKHRATPTPCVACAKLGVITLDVQQHHVKYGKSRGESIVRYLCVEHHRRVHGGHSTGGRTVRAVLTDVVGLCS